MQLINREEAISSRFWLEGLRPYQLECRRQIMEAWASGHRRLLFQLCTGGGKSIIIRSIVLNLWLKNKKVLLVCQDGRILAQLVEHCLVGGIPKDELGIIKAWRSGEFPLELHKPVQVAMMQTLATTWNELKSGLFKFEPDVIICDEAHHCDSQNGYYELWTQFASTRMLAVTATPARPNNTGFYYPQAEADKKSRKPLFDKLILGPAKRSLIDLGFLPECETYFGLTPNLKGVAKKKGEFVVEGADGLEARYNTGIAGAQLRGDIVAKWREYVFERFGRAPTLCFGVSVKHAEDIAREFRQNGIKAVALHGKGLSRIEQNERLRQFISGEAVILVLCGMGQEGFDLATLAKSMGLEAISVFCVIKALATNSLVKNSQIDGRIRGIDLMQWDWRGLAPEPEKNDIEPRPDDVVLGKKKVVPAGALVLGGIEGVKSMLASHDLSGRIRGVRKAIKYNWLDLLTANLSDPSPQIRTLVGAILDTPEHATKGKLLYGVILDCGNNLERHGLYDSEHEWTLEGVRLAPVKAKTCPHCHLAGIPTDEEWCLQCGYKFTLKRNKEDPVPDGSGDGEGITVTHDKAAEMVLVDRQKWKEYEKILRTRSSSHALDYLVRSGAAPAELAIAVGQLKKADGSPYKKEAALWRWINYQRKVNGKNWLPTEEKLIEWCEAFKYKRGKVKRWMEKLRELQGTETEYVGNAQSANF